MNREQRERHEQGETDFTNFRSFRVFHGSLLGTLHFTEGHFFLHGSRFPPWKSTGDTPFFLLLNTGETPRRIRHPRGGKILPEATSCLLGTLRLRQTFAVFAYFAVKITTDTPFFLHGFRVGGEARRAFGERVSRHLFGLGKALGLDKVWVEVRHRLIGTPRVHAFSGVEAVDSRPGLGLLAKAPIRSLAYLRREVSPRWFHRGCEVFLDIQRLINDTLPGPAFLILVLKVFARL